MHQHAALKSRRLHDSDAALYRFPTLSCLHTRVAHVRRCMSRACCSRDVTCGSPTFIHTPLKSGSGSVGTGTTSGAFAVAAGTCPARCGTAQHL